MVEKSSILDSILNIKKSNEIKKEKIVKFLRTLHRLEMIHLKVENGSILFHVDTMFISYKLQKYWML